MPYYQLAAQAERQLVEHEQQAQRALQQQADDAAAATESAVTALQARHETEVGCFKFFFASGNVTWAYSELLHGDASQESEKVE